MACFKPRFILARNILVSGRNNDEQPVVEAKVRDNRGLILPRVPRYLESVVEASTIPVIYSKILSCVRKYRKTYNSITPLESKISDSYKGIILFNHGRRTINAL
jgi:hypothetical protein